MQWGSSCPYYSDSHASFLCNRAAVVRAEIATPGSFAVGQQLSVLLRQSHQFPVQYDSSCPYYSDSHASFLCNRTTVVRATEIATPVSCATAGAAVVRTTDIATTVPCAVGGAAVVRTTDIATTVPCAVGGAAVVRTNHQPAVQSSLLSPFNARRLASKCPPRLPKVRS